MAQSYINGVAGLSKLGLPASIERGKAAPLDLYFLHDTYADALAFAKTHAAAYPYQPVAVDRDTDVTKNGVYYIINPGTSATLQKVNFGESVDVNSTIFPEDYSELVATCDGTKVGCIVVISSAISNGQSGDAAKTYEPGLYIVSPGNTIDSLKSLSVSSADGSSVADQVTALGVRVGTLETTVGSGTTGLVGKVAALEAVGAQANVIEGIKVNGTLVTPENKIVDITVPTGSGTSSTYSLVKDTNSGDYAAVYHFTKDGANVGDAINIPKDLVVNSGSVETKTESGDWGDAGTYIVLVLNDSSSTKLYIPADSLIKYVTGGDTDEISISVDSDTHIATANLRDGSIAEARLDSTLRAKINGKVDSVIETSGNKAIIFNEFDGGGAKFEHSDGTISFIGVNNGGANGIAGQIYAVDKTNVTIGTKINIEKDKITYIKNKATSARTADDEIATKGDISTAIANIEVQIDDSTIKKNTNNKLYVSTANLSVGGTNLGVVKNGGNVEIQNDGTMMMIWSD